MPEWPINKNNQEEPEKESAEVLAYKKEVEERIKNLLETNSDLRNVAKFLGAEKYLRIFPGKRQTVIFKAKDFIYDQIKSQKFLKLPTKFLKTNDVILPPDPGEIITGSGEGMEPKEYIPRSQYLIELLTEMDLDYELTEGENTPNMMRKLSYYGVVIKEIKKLVLVNNEEGNATFIIHDFEGDIEEAKKYSKNISKDGLKIRRDVSGDVSYVEYPGDKEKWKLAIRDLLENGVKERKEKIENGDEKMGSIRNGEGNKEILSFKEARKKARGFGFTSFEDYRKRYKEILGLPSNPGRTYKNNGWRSFADFLDLKIEYRKSEEFLSFEEAKKKAKEAGFAGQEDYKNRYKEITGLPSSPNDKYEKSGWKNWNDFLGKENKIERQKQENILSFSEAREKARNFGFVSSRDYEKRYKKIIGLPSNPNDFYKNNGWKGWPDFIGTGKENKKISLSYKMAQKKVKDHGFTSSKDYIKRYNEVSGLPSRPDSTYSNKGWIDWDDFLGKKKEK